MPKTTDEAVLALLRKVREKKEEIAKASKKPQWKTNCTIGYDPESTSGRVNIMTVRDQRKLVDLYAFLVQRQSYGYQACKELGFEQDSSYMGYQIEDWLADLKARAAQLSVEHKKKELDELDARVNKLVSAEQRREMELAELQKELGE